MSSGMLSRRQLLRILAGTAVAGPVAQLLGVRSTSAATSTAKRAIFFYFPDGVPGPSAGGDPSKWHCTGSEHTFQLGEVLSPLQPLKSHCLFFNGLTMGPVDSGSHPGGAKKLLTGVDGGNGMSVDRYLAQTAGKSAYFPHLVLGAQANHNGASGDKHIVYKAAGQTVAPIDDPAQAFKLLFKGVATGGANKGPDPDEVAIVDAALADLKELQAKLGATEKQKLDLHLQALSEVEKRVKAAPLQGGGGCAKPGIDLSGYAASEMYAPEKFPAVLKAQIDLAVLAMSCDLTRVVTIQASHHTSELIMSRFAGTPMHEPGFDMRSHQASHYGPKHDKSKKEFDHFVKQRKWFVEQFAYLLQSLAKQPEGAGTMLDNSVVLLCTEVCDGNTHLHGNMPLVLAGGAGGAIKGGRLLQYTNRRHGDLLCAIAHAMGQKTSGWGTGSNGPAPGVLS